MVYTNNALENRSNEEGRQEETEAPRTVFEMVQSRWAVFQRHCRRLQQQGKTHNEKRV